MRNREKGFVTIVLTSILVITLLLLLVEQRSSMDVAGELKDEQQGESNGAIMRLLKDVETRKVVIEEGKGKFFQVDGIWVLLKRGKNFSASDNVLMAPYLIEAAKVSKADPKKGRVHTVTAVDIKASDVAIGDMKVSSWTERVESNWTSVSLKKE